MAQQDNASQVPYTNGDDIHFDYTPPADHAAKKKKKKKPKKKPQPHDDVEAILNNPHDDYPTSRVIKQAPNGDVIVESLEPPPAAGPVDVWFQNSTSEEKTHLKKFWESLPKPQRLELSYIDKENLLGLFKSDKQPPKNAQPPTDRSHREPGCTCAHCGRRRTMIVDEVEKLFDDYHEDIGDFIQEIKDIDELNTLPKLLFGGFHKLEDEHKLFKRHRDLRSKQTPEPQEPVLPPPPEPKPEPEEAEAEVNSMSESNSMIYNSFKDLYLKNVSEKLRDNKKLSEDSSKILTKMFDPNIYEALMNLDFDRPKEITDNDANTLEKAGLLREFLSDLRHADKAELEQSMSFIEHMAKMSSIDLNSPNSQQKAAKVLDHIDGQLSSGLSSFADDLLKNNGSSFISMMESLSESRTTRESMLKELGQDTFEPSQLVNKKISAEAYQKNLLEEFEHYQDSKQNAAVEDEEVYDEEYDSEIEPEEFDDDEDDDVSNTESEISEEEKMQEIRELFLMQMIRIFQQRLRNAYKEKLSQDRTQMLIEELEAEENAKKEREAKKLKQKEKAKEKKRLQQLAKEEERKRKEDEKKAKEEEQRLKQEALKTEQRRRKEEAQRKKDEEKQKRIEELKRKELETQKKLELQRQKEEEDRKKKQQIKEKQEQEKLEAQRLKEQEAKRKEEEERLLLQATKEQELVTQLQKQSLADIQMTPEIANQPVFKEDPLSNNFNANPLLEQLYQANSRSLSSTPKTNNMESFIQPSVMQPAGNNNIWLNGSPALNSNGNNTPVLNQQYANGSNNQFAPFTNFARKDSYQLNDPFNSAPVVSGPPPGLQPTTSATNLWNSSNTRNNSIWNSTPKSSGPSIWGNNMLDGANNLASPAPPDTGLIQNAAVQGYQLLQNSNNLEFGMAPSMKLFQCTQSLLAGVNVNYNQFLTSCAQANDLTGYRFEFVYDDFGTVSHMKIGRGDGANGAPMASPGPSTIPPPGLSLNQPPMSNMLGSLNESMGLNSSRGLWN